MSDFYEDGEPPFGETHLRPRYAEHMNCLALSGETPESHLTGRGYRGLSMAAKRKEARIEFEDFPMSDADWDLAETIWRQQRIPHWDDLVRRAS